MTNKYKDIEGAVPVDGDLTPISRKPVNKVEGDEWADMSIGQLHEQRSFMLTRLGAAQSFCPKGVPAIKAGINRLDALLRSKTTNDTTLI